jgi:hypothetical protein
VKKNLGRGGRAAGAAAIAAITAACGISGLSSPAAKPQTGPPVMVTEQISPSAFVAVVGGTGTGHALSWLVSATARPREDFDVLQAGSRPKVLLGSTSPAPAMVIVPGKPAAPGPGATAYLWAVYRKGLKTWHSQISTGKGQVATRTHAATSAWARRLQILAIVSGENPSSLRDPNSLADECELASSALAGLDQEAGNRFGDRRVLLLYVSNLSGSLHAAELARDDVIVVTSYLPWATRASSAQAKLLAAGAARATILGPEATAAQIAQLVTSGLSQK